MTESKYELIETEVEPSEENLTAEEPIVKQKSKKPLIIILISLGAATLMAVSLILGIPYIEYRQAVGMMEKGQYEEAIKEFEGMDDYLNSETLLIECKYLFAKKTQLQAKYVKASQMFAEISEYKDSKTLKTECDYLHALEVFDAKEYQSALELFSELSGYKDSADKILECKYQLAVKLIEDGKIVSAYDELAALGEYKDSPKLLKSIKDTYQMIMAKPKIFVNKSWDNVDRVRIWLATKVIDENTLKITVEGSDGATDNSTEELKGKWNESTGKVEFTGKSYRTVAEWDYASNEYVEKTYCENSNVTGHLYYKNGRLYLIYDNIEYGYTAVFS